jgi:hypothetical protein
MDENECVNRHYGKWSDPNVPHKGWVCIDIEDLGEPLAICKMCESQSIRYVHYMKHREFKDILGVGCICAGKMEENYTKAKSRDDFMKKRASKRLRWIHSSRWKISQKGNDWIKTDDYIVVMMKRNGFWKALIKNKAKNFEKWSERNYESLEKAKLAAFDYLTKVLAENDE